MQKKIIALAVAALASGAALAQSNVTVYGIADASFENVKASGGNGVAVVGGVQNDLASRSRVASNASYIGFKGVEDLGNGLKAVFQFENELDITGQTGNARGTALGNRDTYVGISSGFGTVVAGWLSSPHRSTAAKFDLMPGAAGTGSSLNIIGRVNVGSVFRPINTTTGRTTGTFGTQTGDGMTQANNIGVIARHSAIAYVSPTFSGFSGSLAYVANENKDNTGGLGATYAKRDPKAWNLGLSYDNGPLAVGYSYLAIKDFGVGVAANTADAGAVDLSGAENHRAHLLAAKYAFSTGTTVSAMYDRVNAELKDGPAAGTTGDVTVKRTNWYLAAKQQFGATSVTLAYARAGKNSVGLGSRQAHFTEENLSATHGSGANMYSLRVAHDLSKRTQAYAQYSQIKNQSNASYDFGVGSVNATGTGAGATFAGSDPKALGVGIRHSF